MLYVTPCIVTIWFEVIVWLLIVVGPKFIVCNIDGSPFCSWLS